jgi:hypothetical protein
MCPQRTRSQTLRQAFNELEAAQLVVLADAGPRVTKRWRAALARAALELAQSGCDRDDMRLPIALALYRIFGDTDSDGLAAKVDAILSIHRGEFEALRAQVGRASAPPKPVRRDQNPGGSHLSFNGMS